MALNFTALASELYSALSVQLGLAQESHSIVPSFSDLARELYSELSVPIGLASAYFVNHKVPERKVHMTAQG